MRSALLFYFVATALPVEAKPLVDRAEKLNRTIEYLKCNDGVNLSAFKDSQWNGCSEAELRRTEARLKLAYRKLERSLSDPKHKLPESDDDRSRKLAQAQKSWAKFRDDFCDFRAGSGEAPNPENINLECRIDLTREQIKRIEDSL